MKNHTGRLLLHFKLSGFHGFVLRDWLGNDLLSIPVGRPPKRSQTSIIPAVTDTSNDILQTRVRQIRLCLDYERLLRLALNSDNPLKSAAGELPACPLDHNRICRRRLIGVRTTAHHTNQVRSICLKSYDGITPLSRLSDNDYAGMSCIRGEQPSTQNGKENDKSNED